MKHLLILISLALILSGCQQTPVKDTKHEPFSVEVFNDHFADSLCYKANQRGDSLDLPHIYSITAISDSLITDSVSISKEFHLLRVAYVYFDTVLICNVGFEAGYDEDWAGWWSNGTLLWCTCNADGWCDLQWLQSTWKCVIINNSCGSIPGCKIHGKFTSSWFPPGK